jgi:FkbM family methyltransferase
MKHLLLRWLPYNGHLYNFCKSYVEKHDGDCNGDMATNGEIRVMRQFLPRCSVVFDVGAHAGEWSRLALEINPGLTVHCFEPSRDNFDYLTRNVYSPNVTCNPFGLSSENGERPLFIFRSAPGLHSLYQRRGLEDGWGLKTPTETETVKLETLETYCAERQIGNIDFLKIDVEGHELEVFKGGRSLFAEDRVGMIQFEYGGCNIDSKVLLKDIFEFFSGMNYNFYKIFPDRLKHFQRYDQRLENFKYQNWLMISKKSGTLPKGRAPEAIAPEKSVMERNRLVAREATLVNDLRNEIRVMPEPKEVTDSAAESAWQANRKRLRKCILEEDPQEFLTWDVVTGSMFVGNRPFVESELGYLMSRPDWNHVWEAVIEEDHAGAPKPYRGYRRSSGNRIHQAYHLARFEEDTGLSVSGFPLIVEFGGGYGSLCRLVHKLGFNGQYVIFDLPEFTALQKFYLGSLAMPLIEAKDVPSGRRGILCTSDLTVFESLDFREAKAGLFIATWSLSETDPAFRQQIIRLPAIDGAAAYLIAYQSDFEGVDNPRFFDAWRARKPGIRWVHSDIAHMPGNYYLFGTARTP